MSELLLLILIGLAAGVGVALAVLLLTKGRQIWDTLVARPWSRLWAHLTRQT